MGKLRSESGDVKGGSFHCTTHLMPPWVDRDQTYEERGEKKATLISLSDKRNRGGGQVKVRINSFYWWNSLVKAGEWQDLLLVRGDLSPRCV